MIKIFSIQKGGFSSEKAALDDLEQKLDDIQALQGSLIDVTPKVRHEVFDPYGLMLDNEVWSYEAIVIVRKYE